jgi:glucose/arabinose dehydrogenase
MPRSHRLLSASGLALLGIAAAALAAARVCASDKPPVPPPSPPPPVPAAIAARVKLQLITRESNEAVGLEAVPGEPVGRLFLVEKQGPIRILRGNKIDARPFLDYTGKVSLWARPNSEQGLLGLAFHPHFLENGRFFINFTDPAGDVRIIEYHVDKKDPDRADPATARQIFFLPHRKHDNHNGGDLEFGPDGKLYVGTGDGGSANDPDRNGQNPRALQAKMLRFDVDVPHPVPQIIAQGLRNPWRYTFDRKTGDLYIADVGQNVYEWVHFLPAAKVSGPSNFGWNITEGKHCLPATTCNRAGLIPPVVEYPHSEGCSISGGYSYRGKALPELAGVYFFSDYCTAILRSFRMQDGRAVDQWDWKAALDPDSQLAKVASFGQDQDGELYLVTHEGPIYKFVRR